MPTSNAMQDLNRELARKISKEARDNPASPYAGKFVGIANGQVVVVADNWDDLAQGLRQVEPDTQKTLCLEIGVDYDAAQQIWDPERLTLLEQRAILRAAGLRAGWDDPEMDVYDREEPEQRS
jgi:hypothetical protein